LRPVASSPSNSRAATAEITLTRAVPPPATIPSSTAARVQANIGANHAFAFDLTAACSGFIFALSTAEKLISSGRYQKGFVIGSETLSKVLDWSDRSTAVLFGDGAGGVLLESSERQHFLAESQYTDGSRGESLTCGKVGLSSPYSEKGEVVLGNPIYPFQTTHQIIVRTVHKKPSFPRRRESSL